MALSRVRRSGQVMAKSTANASRKQLAKSCAERSTTQRAGSARRHGWRAWAPNTDVRSSSFVVGGVRRAWRPLRGDRVGGGNPDRRYASYGIRSVNRFARFLSRTGTTRASRAFELRSSVPRGPGARSNSAACPCLSVSDRFLSPHRWRSRVRCQTILPITRVDPRG